MPKLDPSDLNLVLVVLIKSAWYLGEALPAVLAGIIVGPIAGKVLDSSKWGYAVRDQQDAITLGITRVVIGVQLVIAGFQLPSKYFLKKRLPMFICLIPLMAIMWLVSTGCVMLAIPRLSLLSAMVIASCVTCTDPVLSQAVAKGLFADKFVPRPVREIISAEAASNDGFGFPFLMLATHLIQYAEKPILGQNKLVGVEIAENLISTRGELQGRLGGGVDIAIRTWLLETCLYKVLLGLIYVAVVGFAACWMINYAARRKWMDTENYLLLPTAMALFIIGTCGAVGIGEFLACTIAGASLNWDGKYLQETLKLHDEVNSSLDLLLNLGGFMYLGTVIPFKDFHQSDLNVGTFFALSGLILLFRRIPGVLILYKLMLSCVANWKEALFMGYFGPIGIGAVFYVEYAKSLFPKISDLDPADVEVRILLTVTIPVVYFLVIFSIAIHGLSIPALNAFYRIRGMPPIREESPVELSILSSSIALPINATTQTSQKSVTLRSMVVHNRFSVPDVAPKVSYSGTMTRWDEWGRELTIELPKASRWSSNSTILDGVESIV